MRKIIITVALSLSLAGCSTTSIFTGGTSLTASIANPVTPAMLYKVENGMVVAISGLLAYKSACASKTIPQSCRQVVATLQIYTRKAKPIIAQLRSFVKNNDQINAVLAFNQVADLLANFKSTAAAAGVN